MEQRNKFDEAIKAGIGAIEADPSARVWAGVRAEVGIGPAQSQQWGFKVAAAVAVLFLVGLGYVMNNGKSHAEAQGFMARTKQPRIFVAPIDYNGKAGIYLAKDDATNSQYRPDADVIPWSKYDRQNTANFAVEEKESLQNNLEEHLDLPDMESPQLFTHEQPKPRQNDPRKSPDDRVDPVKDWQEGLAPANSIASASSKRTYRVPKPGDIKLEDIKKKSGAFLGTLTAKASDFLGMDASYVEHTEDDRKMSTFSADFGLFKIKKVKTKK